MTARDRLPLIALLWVLTAAGAGLLFAWLLRPERETVTRVLVEERILPGTGGGPGAPPSSGEGRGGTSAGRGPATAPSAEAAGDPAASPSSEAEPLPFASVLVTVLGVDGAPLEEGVVYAVGAGEPGSDDEERVFRVAIDGPDPVRLGLPLGGVYDIGCRHATGTVLLRDVRVAPGDENVLTLRVAAGLPVHVRVEGPWPPPGAPEAAMVVHLFTPEEGLVQFPGRGERGWAEGSVEVGSDGTGASGPLEPGRDFEVNVAILEPGERPATVPPKDAGSPLVDSPRFAADPDRDRVRPGETLRVRVKPWGALLLRPAGGLPPPEGKKKGNTPVQVLVERDGKALGALSLRVPWRAPGAADPAAFPWSLGPGTYRVSWSGAGVLAGSREGIVVGPGEMAEVEIPVHPDPRGTPEAVPQPPVAEEAGGAPGGPEPLAVRVEGVPPNRSATVFGFLREEGGGEEAVSGSGGQGDGEVVLGGEVRALPEVAAVAPPFLASDFAPVPSTGGMHLPLRPAGLLLVAPVEVLPEEFGAIRLRRADGRPLPVAEDGGWNFSWAGREVQAEPGILLGPFPEGTLVFEVRLGGLRLPDVAVRVRAGRVEVLRIAR